MNEPLGRAYYGAVQSSVRVSVVIPVFDQLVFTRICLASLEVVRFSETEIVVVDNGSTDGTSDFLASWEVARAGRRVISVATNQGFARACNMGAEQARGELLVFLNNDTHILPSWLPPLANALERGEARIAGSRLLYPNGRIQHAGVAFDERGPHHIFAGLRGDLPCVSRPRRWQAVTGASLAIRARDFTDLNGFDEAYVNSFEDVDLCLRACKRGWTILYLPDSTAYHFEGMTEGRLGAGDTRNYDLFHSRWQGRYELDLRPALDAEVADGLDLADRIPPKVELRAAYQEAVRLLDEVEGDLAQSRQETAKAQAERANAERELARYRHAVGPRVLRGVERLRRIARALGLGLIVRWLRMRRRSVPADA